MVPQDKLNQIIIIPITLFSVGNNPNSLLGGLLNVNYKTEIPNTMQIMPIKISVPLYSY
jgi:hypothetical protein